MQQGGTNELGEDQRFNQFGLLERRIFSGWGYVGTTVITSQARMQRLPYWHGSPLGVTLGLIPVWDFSEAMCQTHCGSQACHTNHYMLHFFSLESQ